ncbi:MAG: CBS domain-containing protein [Candidatus Limnocylindria bacterium]
MGLHQTHPPPPRLVNVTVADAMRPGVVTCDADQLLPAVAATMATRGIHMAVIPSPRNGAAFAITDLDLIRASLRGTEFQTAGDIAREPMATIVSSATLERAVAKMATLDASHLLVTDRGVDWPVGVLSSLDIASVVSGRKPRMAREIRPAPARPLVSTTRLSDTTVGAVMHPGVIFCLPDAPMRELAGRMADLRIHCVAVSGIGMRPDGEHLVWGLVSDMDVVHAAYREELGAPAGELAATSPIALPEDASLERAATLMIDHDASHVVAVRRTGLPSGVVSTLDVIRILAAG